MLIVAVETGPHVRKVLAPTSALLFLSPLRELVK